jgi:hypothetical protein
MQEFFWASSIPMSSGQCVPDIAMVTSSSIVDGAPTLSDILCLCSPVPFGSAGPASYTSRDDQGSLLRGIRDEEVYKTDVALSDGSKVDRQHAVVCLKEETGG